MLMLRNAGDSSLAISLTPLTPGTLPLVREWFEDPETVRWLGDGAWPERALRLASESPTESDVTGRYVWLASLSAGEPVGLVDVESYSDGTAGLALVVAPARRGGGLGKGILAAVAAHPALEGTRTIRVGVEPENRASVECFESARYAPESEEPDAEGFIYFARDMRPSEPSKSRKKE